MDTATIAQGLRASAALIDLASRTATALVVDTLEHLADRVHPHGLEGYAEFDVRLDGLGPADGYFVETGERA